MSKAKDLFKNKKFLTGISVGAATVIIASSTLGIMLPSYYAWKEYYDTAIADREYQKYLQTLPLEMTGLSAALGDNVTYYDNGKAAPKNSDFDVVAHFTEKGRAFDEILQPGDFSIEVPDGFATDGGTVKVTYVFTPPADESDDESTGGENTPDETPTEPEAPPEPKEFTAEVECSLEDVAPVSVSLKSRPYRVFYSDDMAFDTDGMVATVNFNDGHTELSATNELIANTDKLTAETKSVSVTWSRGGTEFPITVPVTVVAKTDYADGDIVALNAEGKCYLAEGADTSTAKPTVRATYLNGNRLLLRDDQYTVKGNVDVASFTKKCILNVLLKNDASVFTRVAATVKTGIEAETADFTGSKTEETHGDATVVVPQKGAVMSVGFVSDDLAKPDLYLRVSLKGDEPVNLADVIKMSANGKSIVVPDKAIPAGEGFYDVVLPRAVLKAGDNTLSIEFYGDDASRLMIDRLDVEAGYKGEFYASTEQYLTVTAASGEKASFKNEITKQWDAIGGKAYGHGICSDGTYLYIIGTSWAGNGVGRGAVVIKYDPVAKKRIAKSAATEAQVLESTAGVTYYDGKIIIYYMDGRRMYVPVDEFTDECVFEEYDGFDFEGLENEPLNDVYYNPTQQKFAVFASSSIYLFGTDKKLINVFPIASEDASSRRMTGSADYIYVNYTSDGRYSPLVHIYDWNGEHIGKQTVPVSEKFLTSNGICNTGGTNIQGLAIVNGDYYATMLRFRQKNGDTTVYGDSCCMLKISMRGLSKNLVPDLTPSEYSDACDDKGVTAEFTATPSAGEYGEIADTEGYAMGGASDGEYLYVANNSDGNTVTSISKVKLSDYSVEAKSAKFNVAESVKTTDNSRLFIKGDTLYCVAGDVFSIKLADFDDRCVLTRDDAMTALLSQNGAHVLKAAAYDKTAEKYVVLANDGKLYILDGAGAQQGDVITPVYSGMSVSSVTCDNEYIYVSYKANGQNTLPLDVYTWTGEKKKTLQATGIDHGTYQKKNDDGTTSTVRYNYNIQAVYIVNGDLHASVCTWNSGCRPMVFYDWTIAPDMSVFTKVDSLADYLTECDNVGVSPSFTSRPTTGEVGKIEGSPQNYSMGAAQYGEYMFIASAGGDNAGTLISKVRLSDNTVLATSNWLVLTTAVAGRDNSRLFIKDDTLYCVAGDVFSIKISDFAAGCNLTRDDAMTKLLSQNGKHVLKSAYYNAEADKYVVLTDQGQHTSSVIYVLNGDGTLAVSEALYTCSGQYTSSICGDGDYFYLSFSNNGQQVLPIYIFDWNGEQKYSAMVSGINLGGKVGANYNIQAIYVIDGKLHASVCTWSGGYNYFNDYTIDYDMSVFND